MEKEYAIVELNLDNYRSLARAITKDFSTQIETMLQPAVASAVNSLVYRLFDKISDERYADDFSKHLEGAVISALKSPELAIPDGFLSKLQSQNVNLSSKLCAIEQKAKDIQEILGNVQMSGKSHEISAINAFVNDLAWPQSSRESDA